MSPDTIIFPMCGLTYSDLLKVAETCRNKRATAKRLGVDERHLYRVVKKCGLESLFTITKPRSRCLSREDIISIASDGCTMRDSAYIAGVCYHYFKELVSLYGLREYFPSNSEAKRLARKGYAQ